jgi:hypothetical protein
MLADGGMVNENGDGGISHTNPKNTKKNTGMLCTFFALSWRIFNTKF